MRPARSGSPDVVERAIPKRYGRALRRTRRASQEARNGFHSETPWPGPSFERHVADEVAFVVSREVPNSVMPVIPDLVSNFVVNGTTLPSGSPSTMQGCRTARSRWSGGDACACRDANSIANPDQVILAIEPVVEGCERVDLHAESLGDRRQDVALDDKVCLLGVPAGRRGRDRQGGMDCDLGRGDCRQHAL